MRKIKIWSVIGFVLFSILPSLTFYHKLIRSITASVPTSENILSISDFAVLVYPIIVGIAVWKYFEIVEKLNAANKRNEKLKELVEADFIELGHADSEAYKKLTVGFKGWGDSLVTELNKQLKNKLERKENPLATPYNEAIKSIGENYKEKRKRLINEYNSIK